MGSFEPRIPVFEATPYWEYSYVWAFTNLQDEPCYVLNDFTFYFEVLLRHFYWMKMETGPGLEPGILDYWILDWILDEYWIIEILDDYEDGVWKRAGIAQLVERRWVKSEFQVRAPVHSPFSSNKNALITPQSKM